MIIEAAPHRDMNLFCNSRLASNPRISYTFEEGKTCLERCFASICVCCAVCDNGFCPGYPKMTNQILLLLSSACKTRRICLQSTHGRGSVHSACQILKSYRLLTSFSSSQLREHSRFNVCVTVPITETIVSWFLSIDGALISLDSPPAYAYVHALMKFIIQNACSENNHLSRAASKAEHSKTMAIKSPN